MWTSIELWGSSSFVDDICAVVETCSSVVIDCNEEEVEEV